MRLDKALANQGFGSRKDVKKLIRKGLVIVNSEVSKDGSIKITPEQDEIIVNGQKLEYRKNIYLMLNKPTGVISATRDRVETCVTDLLNDEYRRYSLFPAGRLDKDTEGLILLTNDGDLSHRLLSPNNHVEKVYEAKIRGKITEDDIEAFRSGIELKDGYVTKSATLEIINSDYISHVKITISEGKYHQIRRMIAALNKKVLELRRLQLGSLKLDPSLEHGEYRELTDEELEQLMKY
ncbi:pseudouridine synthase [Bacillaceae bacterium W0354]